MHKLFIGCVVLLGCDVSEPPYVPPPLPNGAVDASPEAAPKACSPSFQYVPPLGTAPKEVALVGEWNQFAEGLKLTRTERGFEGSLPFSEGQFAYQLSVDGVLTRDTTNPLRAYANGTEMSLLRTVSCKLPRVTLVSKAVTRTSSTTFTAHIRVDGESTPSAALRSDSATTPVSVQPTDQAGIYSVTASNLTDGKYTLAISASNAAGSAEPLRLVFWAEPSEFSWNGSTIYMAMSDRFRDGNPSINPSNIAGADGRAQFLGGDLDGVKQAIADGSFDKLGVKVLWLSPFHTNPAGAFPSDDGTTMVSGYHGYWPIKPREVDARIGGNSALLALVAEAHKHGIRVMQDFVVNHVHKDHEYVIAHPDWFRTGCVCGTENCDWTGKRLECLFSNYLPDVNWTHRQAAEQFIEDAIWWIDTFHLDGMRIDAVKHVEDAAVFNLVDRVRTTFEQGGTRFFLTGETAMGWGGDLLESSSNDYGTINRYMGRGGLDGQFDFVLHHAVSYRVFAYQDRGLAHAAYWTQASQWQYAPGSVMTPYLGSHDTPRFITWATYRDGDRNDANNKWTHAASRQPDSEAFIRQRFALAWLLTLPGAPLLYYGDEYGSSGGADPNNRAMMKRESDLNAEEQATLAWSRKLGTLRTQMPALRFGSYEPLASTDDTLVVLRQAKTGESAFVAFNRTTAPVTLSVALPQLAGIKDGTKLTDRIGNATTTIAKSTITITLAARSAAVYAE